MNVENEYDAPEWNDGMDAASAADRNFLNQFAKRTGFKTADTGERLPIAKLMEHPKGLGPPFVYMTGTGKINVTAEEARILRQYLTARGMLVADCGASPWDGYFRLLMRDVFPEGKLVDIPNGDSLFHAPFDFTEGAPSLWRHGGTRMLGIKQGERWAVVYHPGDLNDAWKSGHSGLA